MKSLKISSAVAAVALATSLSEAGVYNIGGFSFDEKNSVTTAAVVEGPLSLADHSNRYFARYGEEYVRSKNHKANAFANFDHGKSIGALMGRSLHGSVSRHISFAEPGDSTVMTDVHRSTIELTWGSSGLPNKAGADFVVYESGSWEGFAVSVRKTGSAEFSRPRYQFADAADKLHNVNAVAFDLSKFGLAEGETISAIRIRNLFNSQARNGMDRVDDASGQGTVIYPGEPEYKTAYPLLSNSHGKEFVNEELGADLIYVAGLQDVVPLKSTATKTQSVTAQTAQADAARK